MPRPAQVIVERLSAAFEQRRDPIRAGPMAAYMRGQFRFLGIPTPERRQVMREVLGSLQPASEAELGAVVRALWERPEREFQYAACDLLSRYVRLLSPSFIGRARQLIISKSWWDTVDALAASVAGPMVLAHPPLIGVMDGWINDDDLWLRRTALLHQLRFKQRTDSGRLFRYCALRATEPEFFIRKAIGWALREYSKTNAEAVRAFVAAHEDELSGLSKREALLWLNGGRRAGRSGPP